MSAKNNLPQYVNNAITNDRNAQIVMVGTLAVYVFGEVKAGRIVDKLGDTIAKFYPHRSLKTWQNYATAAAALVKPHADRSKVEAKLAALHAEGDPAAASTAFSQWLESQLRSSRYTTSVEDVTRYAKNRPSLSMVGGEKEKNAQAESAAQAQAHAEAEEQAKKDALAAATNRPDALPDAAPAPEAPQEQAPVLFTVTRNSEGTLTFEHAAMDRATIVALALYLETMLENNPDPANNERTEAPAPAPAPAPEEATA